MNPYEPPREVSEPEQRRPWTTRDITRVIIGSMLLPGGVIVGFVAALSLLTFFGFGVHTPHGEVAGPVIIAGVLSGGIAAMYLLWVLGRWLKW